jgi:hypothetical protein
MHAATEPVRTTMIEKTKLDVFEHIALSANSARLWG